MVHWEEYINPVESFSSRAHIGICQNAPRSLREPVKGDVCVEFKSNETVLDQSIFAS